MKKYLVYLILFVFAASVYGCSKKDNPVDDDKDHEGWQLVWSDEFNYNGLPDSTKWSFEVGGHGWGNQEEQFYTSKRSKNARVENDVLIIEAHKEQFQENNYTSARIVSTDKGDWTYGKFEIRARLPRGRGTWPAIWMLPTDWTYGGGGWPDNGEIDIMEHVGYNPNVIVGSVHTKKYNHSIGTQKNASVNIPDVMTAYHVYSIEWNETEISFFVDSFKYFTFKNENTDWETWPFDKDFHFILNIAIGGTWGGQQGIDDLIFPTRMEIDYVRVYQKSE